MRIRGIIKEWLYESIPGFAGRFPYFGTKVFFPKNSHLFKRVCKEGIYEIDILGLLKKLIKPDCSYFDVGANIGLLSVPILKANPTCTVVSFEPSPNSLPFLAKTHRESSYKDRWTVLGNALGSKCMDTSFCIHDPSEGAFDGIRDTKRVRSSNTVTVQMKTLDDVWQELGRPKVSLIKIDVEGSEIEVLNGAQNCLSKDRPFVVLEWNSTNLAACRVAPDTLLDFAQSNGFFVFTAPELSPIINKACLHWQMKRGIENFLLSPESDFEVLFDLIDAD